jgi:preprotein translocase subunit SecD
MRSNKHIWASVVLLVAIATLGFFIAKGDRFPFSFGLDLVGGTELVYKADTSNVEDVSGAMESLKEVVERRIAQSNLSGALGALEPNIQTESAGLISGNQEERLIVELPGVTDIEQAKGLIGRTPILEFRLANPNAEEILAANPDATLDELFLPTNLTGRYLTKARVEFDPSTRVPSVGLVFNEEGAQLFAELTREHIGEVLAIVLDGQILSAPQIQSEITNGQAQVTGNFTPDEAKVLVRDINYGALPVPISILSSKTVGATLGDEALSSGVRAGVMGFVILVIFMILWYRLPGAIASLALVAYIVISLAIFALIPVTLTAAGIAGFILSIGMAVDANILIFERTKEEIKKGKSIHDSLHEGFTRAWSSIRDSNISSIITAIILFWLGTSAVKGFALTLGIGVIVSMLSAITLSRTFLFAVAPTSDTKLKRFLFSNGLHK